MIWDFVFINYELAGAPQQASRRRAAKNFGTYFPPGNQHTFLTDLFDVKLTDAEVDGVRLTDWVSDIIDGVGTSRVGP